MNRIWFLRGCAAVAYLILVGLINAPYRFVPIATQILGDPIGDAPFDLKLSLDEMANPVIAGWPAKYMVRHEFADGYSTTSWSAAAAAINLAVGMSVFAAFGWYVYRTDKRREAASNIATRGFALSDLLLLVFLVAIPLAYWKQQTRLSKSDIQVLNELRSAGTIVRQALVPELLADYLPKTLVVKWSRITCADLNRPSEEQVRLLVQQPYLRSIRLGGGDYSLESLQYLPSMNSLQDVRISGRGLDNPSVMALASCPLVSSLNISRTNCNAEALHAFATMPRLERLMAFDTAIPYQAWRDTPCKEKLTSLIISRPLTGQGGSVELDGWPRLQSLAIRSLDEYRNAQLFSIRIANVPQLQKLTIDALQRINLDLDNAPQLTEVECEYLNLHRRLADGERAPTKLWITRASLRSMPKLANFDFYTADFESVTLDGCESVNMVKGTSRHVRGGQDQQYDLDQDLAITQNVVRSFGKLTGVKYLALWGQPLRQVDLSPLAENQDARIVDFRGSNLGRESLQQLAGMKQLISIGLADVDSEPSFVELINEQFPNLEYARLDPSSTIIHFENQPKLTTIALESTHESRINRLKLVSVPELVSPMIVCEQGGQCIVHDAAKLRGLAVLSPQAEIEVSGVGGLEWFVAGGPNLTTEVVTEVLRASGLQRLTLAYPAAARSACEDLLNLQSLQELIIPGSPIDDDFVSRWTIPSSLVKLDLDHCQLSAASVKKIIDRGNWIALRLAGSAADPDSLSSLGASPNLKQLSLGGATVDSAAMKMIGSLNELTSLDLANSTLPPGSLALLANPRLAEIDLNGASFDSQDLAALAQKNNSLKFLVNPADVSVPVMTWLLSQQRVHDPDAWVIRFPQDDQTVVGYDATGRAVYESARDRKSGPEFECPVLNLEWPRMLAQEGPTTPRAIVPAMPTQAILKTLIEQSDVETK